MAEVIKKFSIDDIEMYRNDDDMDFAEVEIWCLADGENSHHNPFTKEVLEKDADTFKGKFIVAKYDIYTDDATTHVPDESIIGYVDPREDIQFKDKIVNGETREFVVTKGLLSKIYATDIVEMFRKNNNRTVSCEFSCNTQYEEDNDGNPINEFGQKMFGQDNPVLSYHIHGITVLGLNYKPSVPQTEIKVKKFAEEIDKNYLRKFAEDRKEKLNLVSHPIKKIEYVDSDWNGEDAKHKAIKEKNFNTMAKSIFLKLDSDYKERKIGSLHYPVMGLYDGVWKYNSNGLSSARAYGEQHDPSVADKAIAIQKKLGLFNKEDKMADKEKKPNDNKEEDIIMEKKDKEMANDSATTEEMSDEKDKEMGCGKKGMSEDSKAIDETKDEKDKDKKEEKKFSLNTCADVSDIMAMLENETEDNQELAKKVMDMDAKGIIDTVMSFAKENADLKKYKADKQAEEKDKKLSQIMASVKEDIEPKKFSELQEEGKNLSINELGGFENKVKAFAYESSKGKEHKDDDGIMRFACNESIFEHKDNGSKLWN